MAGLREFSRSSLHFRQKLLLALREFLAERLEIHFGGFEFREKLFFLFLDVLLYHFAENPNLGVVEILADLYRFDFRNQIFHSGMFDDRFVDEIVVLRRFAGLRIENFFFDLRVDLQPRQIFCASSALRSSSSFSSSYSS